MRLSRSPSPKTRAAAERRARLARAALRGSDHLGSKAEAGPVAQRPDTAQAPAPPAETPHETRTAPNPDTSRLPDTGPTAPTAVLRYRPHHFLCSLGFEGKGYSPDFTANMTAIVMGRLRSAAGPQVEIEVTFAADDICTPCPARIGQGCESQGKIEKLDRAHAAALGLADGERLRWGVALERMRALPEGILDEICAPCQWLAYGMCNRALERLHGKAED